TQLGVSLCVFTAPPHACCITRSLHGALPISVGRRGSVKCPTRTPPMSVKEPAEGSAAGCVAAIASDRREPTAAAPTLPRNRRSRSEEHTSELQSPDHLVCRLLLERNMTIVVR